MKDNQIYNTIFSKQSHSQLGNKRVLGEKKTSVFEHNIKIQEFHKTLS